MMQNEMVSALRKTFTLFYDQVSEPQYYQGQGPYLLALMKKNDEYEFHCYEIIDAETFLSAPEQFPSAFHEPEFLFKAADTLNLDGIENSGRYFSILLRKVVPDIPACRLAVQTMYKTNPELVANIIFIDTAGKLFPATDILFNPVLLN